MKTNGERPKLTTFRFRSEFQELLFMRKSWTIGQMTELWELIPMERNIGGMYRWVEKPYSAETTQELYDWLLKLWNNAHEVPGEPTDRRAIATLELSGYLAEIIEKA